MDFKKGPKQLLVDLINSNNSYQHTINNIVFEVTKVNDTGYTESNCLGYGYDIPTTVNYRRIDLNLLMSEVDKNINLSLLSGELLPTSKLWTYLNDRYPILLDADNFTAIHNDNTGTVTISAVENNLAFFGSFNLNNAGAVTATKISEVYCRTAGKSSNSWIILYPILGTSEHTFYKNHWMYRNGVFYSISRATAEAYINKKNIKYVGDISTAGPYDSLTNDGNVLLLESGYNNTSSAVTSTVYIDGMGTVESITIKMNVLLYGYKFPTARETNMRYLINLF